MNLTTLCRATLVGAAALLGVATHAADDNTSTIKFSNPDQPGTVRVSLARGNVIVRGGDGHDVVVRSAAQPQAHTRKDGLRVLTESASYSLTEKDNVVTLDATSDGWVGTSSDFQITVPHDTNVVVTSSLSGDITCSGLTGDIEIKCLHGEVHLSDIVAGVLVETLNGEITARIRELHEGKALSFTSMNGQVTLYVPETAKANVRLRTQNGTILTDFDDKALVTRVESVAGGRGHARTLALTPEMREAFREAGRAAKVATEQAANALREAAEAAREGVQGDQDKSGAVPAALPTPPMPPMMPAIPTVTGGKLVTGTLNGGGPEINVATMNGDVTLRHAK